MLTAVVGVAQHCELPRVTLKSHNNWRTYVASLNSLLNSLLKSPLVPVPWLLTNIPQTLHQWKTQAVYIVIHRHRSIYIYITLERVALGGVFGGTPSCGAYLTLERVALGEVLAAVLVPRAAHLAPAPDVRDRVHHPAVQEAKPGGHRTSVRWVRRRGGYAAPETKKHHYARTVRSAVEEVKHWIYMAKENSSRRRFM